MILSFIDLELLDLVFARVCVLQIKVHIIIKNTKLIANLRVKSGLGTLSVNRILTRSVVKLKCLQRTFCYMAVCFPVIIIFNSTTPPPKKTTSQTSVQVKIYFYFEILNTQRHECYNSFSAGRLSKRGYTNTDKYKVLHVSRIQFPSQLVLPLSRRSETRTKSCLLSGQFGQM